MTFYIVGNITSGDSADVTANHTETGVSLDFVLPVGSKGPQGEQGQTGSQGEQGEQGSQGDPGATPTISVGNVSSGDEAKVTVDPTANGVKLNFVLVSGSTGSQDKQGEQGNTDPQGLTGTTPTLVVGNVSSGDTANVTANPTETGVSLDFVMPIGSEEPQGKQGEQGPQGEQGEQGDIGLTGDTGPAPKITVTEDTPTSYKLSFQTSEQDIVTSNLKSMVESHNMDLSTAGNSVDISLGNLILTYAYLNSSSIKITIRATNASKPILADIRRTSIYDGSSIDSQTNNNTTITTTLMLDSIVYSQSQEMHWMRIRQQDPDSSLWSMCEVVTFASARGARTSVCIDWLYLNSPF